MPVMTVRTSLAAAASAANIFTGNLFEYPPGGKITRIRGGAVADVNLGTATLTVGDRIIAQDYPVPVEAREGVVSRQDDFNWVTAARPGERMSCALLNGNAAASVITVLLELN